MTGIVVLASPLLLGVGFGLAFLAYRLLLGPAGARAFERHGTYLYASILLVLLALVCLDESARAGLAQVVSIPTGRPIWWLPAWLAGAVAAGAALFVAELWGVVLLRALPGIRRLMERPSMEGQVSRLVDRPPSAAVVLGAGVVIVLVEELIWRGHLIRFLQGQWQLPLAAAVLVAAVSFGLNHAYFGARSVIFKALHGVAWGVLLLVSGTLWPPVASHLAFNFCVWGRLAKGTSHDASNDTDSIDRVQAPL
jgi:membrane protease YdiL (CAAX protease family)